MSDQPENEDRIDGVEGTQPTEAGSSQSEKPKKKRFAWFRGRSLKFWFRTLLLLVLAYVVLVPFARPLLVMAWSVMPLIALPLVGIPLGIYLMRRNWRKVGVSLVILTLLADWSGARRQLHRLVYRKPDRLVHTASGNHQDADDCEQPHHRPTHGDALRRELQLGQPPSHWSPTHPHRHEDRHHVLAGPPALHGLVRRDLRLIRRHRSSQRGGHRSGCPDH